MIVEATLFGCGYAALGGARQNCCRQGKCFENTIEQG